MYVRNFLPAFSRLSNQNVDHVRCCQCQINDGDGR
jgi:hypothetical protein